MPFTMGRCLAIVVSLATLACGGAVTIGSSDTRFTDGDQEVRLLESGAVIVGKRQVGRIESTGKIVDTRGQLRAWIHPESIRLPGGVTLPLKQDAEGGLYVPADAQAEAGLDPPMESRVRANGTVSRTAGARGIAYRGSRSASARRQLLAVLLLTRHGRW
ncbi:MAG TPA: hypothetical protein VML75_04265 [Kofleriaceae bacterium]|nr:hypothetical protein [Kofleriaceae bacterium]